MDRGQAASGTSISSTGGLKIRCNIIHERPSKVIYLFFNTDSPGQIQTMFFRILHCVGFGITYKDLFLQ